MVAESLETSFLRQGIITQDQLAKAQSVQAESGGKIGDILIALGLITEDDFQRTLASLYHLDFFDKKTLSSLSLEPSLLRSFPASIALESLALPIKREGSELQLAVLAPLPRDVETLLRDRLGLQTFRYALASREALLRALNQAYGRSQAPSSSEPFDASSLRGRVLQERWLLDELLGQGGSGVVFQGRHLSTGKSAALKLLLSRHADDQEQIDRFRQEASILLQLTHPRIVEVYEYGFEEGLGFFLAMEFLQGCSLADLVEKNHPYEDSDILRIAIQICEAMEYAHQKSIVHRDLKPANIFLVGGPEKRNAIKVLDFGIARFDSASSSPATKGLLGTPRYLSPEQAMGAEIDHRTDIYSLCVILFEGLARKPLFEAESHYQYLMRHAYSKTPLLSEAVTHKRFLPSVERLIQRGLSKNPKDRPASMRDLRHELQILLPSQIQLDKTPVSSRPPLSPPAPSSLPPPSLSASSSAPRSPSPSTSAPIFGKRPTHEQIPSIGKRPTYEQIPSVGKRPTYEQIPSIGKRPTHEQIPSVGKRPTYEQIPSVGKRPTHEQIPSVPPQDGLSLLDTSSDRPKRRRGLSFEELAKIPAAPGLSSGAVPSPAERSFRPAVRPPPSSSPSLGSAHPSPSTLHPATSQAHPSPSASHPAISQAHPSPSASHPATSQAHPSPSTLHLPMNPEQPSSPSLLEAMSSLHPSGSAPLFLSSGSLSNVPRSSDSSQSLPSQSLPSQSLPSQSLPSRDLPVFLRRPALFVPLIIAFALFFFLLGRCSVQTKKPAATSFWMEKTSTSSYPLGQIQIPKAPRFFHRKETIHVLFFFWSQASVERPETRASRR